MVMTSDPLKELTGPTIHSYDHQAESFWEGTRDHDVSQNIAALVRALGPDLPQRILDFGCGPGRDLAAWRSLGHEPVGVEGSANFCEMARAHSGCEVLHQNFLSLELPAEHFDGVFANASLFHVPVLALPRVLDDLFATLKPGGALFSSNPRGANVEGWNGSRYGRYHDIDAWMEFLGDAGFVPIEHYYRPTGLPRDQQPWLACTFRRPE
jgi:SAM-dependent methyltransferase